MPRTTLTSSELAHFTGSESFYRHSLNRNVVYTEGAQYLAEQGGAYWLLDTIAIAQAHEPKVKSEEFQLWKLTVRPDHTATLTCDDGNGLVIYSQEIPFTDFPLEEIKLYCCNRTIMLTSEY